MKFQIIKQTAFSFDRKGQQVEGIAYSVAHKARVINVSTLNFEKDELVVEGDTLNVKCDIELIADNYADQLTGEIRKGIKLVPKMDLAISSL